MHMPVTVGIRQKMLDSWELELPVSVNNHVCIVKWTQVALTTEQPPELHVILSKSKLNPHIVSSLLISSEINITLFICDFIYFIFIWIWLDKIK